MFSPCVASKQLWASETATAVYAREVEQEDQQQQKRRQAAPAPRGSSPTSRGGANKYTHVPTDDTEDNGAAGEEEGEKNEELRDIFNRETQHPWARIMSLCMCFVGVIALNVAKEFTPCGSTAYIISICASFPWILAYSVWYRNMLMVQHKDKMRLGYHYVKGDLHWNSETTLKFPLICTFAGLFAGMFGVGGGIIKGPLMLEMGVLPPVAAATAAAMILFTT